MIGRKKKLPPVQRSPHINRQQQSTFQYSSNRSASDNAHRSRPTSEQPLRTGWIGIARSKKAIIVTAGSVTLIILGTYLSILSSSPQVVISDGKQPLRSSEAYNQVASEVTGNGLLNRSKLTLNRQKLTETLQAKFPELIDVQVTTPVFGRAAVVKATSATPAVVLATKNANYILDTRGIALFDTNLEDVIIETDSLPLINDQSGVVIQAGKPALTTSQISFATEVNRQALAKQIPVESMALNAGGGELYVKHTGTAYFIKYNTYEEPRKSFGTFYATKETIDRTKVIPAEYIDVRVPERAYVK